MRQARSNECAHTLAHHSVVSVIPSKLTSFGEGYHLAHDEATLPVIKCGFRCAAMLPLSLVSVPQAGKQPCANSAALVSSPAAQKGSHSVAVLGKRIFSGVAPLQKEVVLLAWPAVPTIRGQCTCTRIHCTAAKHAAALQAVMAAMNAKERTSSATTI